MFTLAQLLGYPHPDYLLGSLTASQLDDWLAWMRRYHPFPDRHDPYFAMLLSSWTTDSKPNDFILYRDPLDRFNDDMTREELLAKLGVGGIDKA